MQATFEKRPTPRDKALNRLLENNSDLVISLRIYQGVLIVICLAALTNVLGIN